MRILVTGAAGFIGSHLVERLVQRGHDVAGLVRHKEEASVQSAARLAKLSFPNFRWMEATQNLARLSADPFDACIHLAGRSSVRESLRNPGLYEDANTRFSLWLLELVRRAHCRRVIHASTVMIYGKDAPLPYNEAHIGTTPASFYGASKLASETLMNTWRVLHGMGTINLRLFSVYGPELRADCVPHLIATAIANDADFTIFGDGTSMRDYVEIEDVLDAIEAALHAPWTKDFPTSINIGSGIGTRLVELVRRIEQGLNKNARIVHKPALAGELQAVVADVQLAERALKWRPRVGVDDGIRRFTDWFRQSRTL